MLIYSTHRTVPTRRKRTNTVHYNTVEYRIKMIKQQLNII